MNPDLQNARNLRRASVATKPIDLQFLKNRESVNGGQAGDKP
jgi:hypothetical protein